MYTNFRIFAKFSENLPFVALLDLSQITGTITTGIHFLHFKADFSNFYMI